MNRLRRSLLLAIGLLPGVLSHSASAMTLEVGSASTTPGSAVQIGVRLDVGPGEKVAAVQNDITFDPSVVSITRGACQMNPSIDKSISSAVGPNYIRLIVINLGNSGPIPSEILYTCTFQVGPDAPDGNILLNITNVSGSDPAGNLCGSAKSQCATANGIGGSIFVSSASGTGNGGVGSQPQMVPAAPHGGLPAQEAAPAGVVPGGGFNRPVAPEAVPQAPQAQQPVNEAAELPTLSLPSTPTAAVMAVRTGTVRAGAPTPAKTVTTPVATTTTAGTPGSKATPTPKSVE